VHARRNRGEWRAIVGAFERSGQTHEEFCVARGLNIGSFRAWLYRIRRDASTDVRLVPVAVSMSESSETAVAAGGGQAVILVVVGRIELRVPVGSDAAYVAVLVRELDRC
jgi:hypothetical protein